VGKSDLSSPSFEKQPVQRSEQPALHFRNVAQLLAFFRPNIERLLSQIPCLRLGVCQAQREPEERVVMLAHNHGK